MNRSAIYVVNLSNQEVADGGVITFNTVVRKTGNNLRLDANGVEVIGAGYYSADLNVTFTAAGAGTTVIQMYQDGVAIPGAEATLTVAAGTYSVTVPAIVKEYCPCGGGSIITAEVSGLATVVNNAALVVEKI